MSVFILCSLQIKKTEPVSVVFRLPWQLVAFSGTTAQIKGADQTAAAMERDAELRGSHLQSSNMMQSLAWASRTRRTYQFEHISVYVTRIHLLLVNKRTSSVFQDWSPQMSEQHHCCTVQCSWYYRTRTWHFQGQLLLQGQHPTALLALAVGCFASLAVWPYLVLIWLS